MIARTRLIVTFVRTLPVLFMTDKNGIHVFWFYTALSIYTLKICDFSKVFFVVVMCGVILSNMRAVYKILQMTQ